MTAPISIGALTPFLVAAAFAMPVLTLITKKKFVYDLYALIVTFIALVTSVYNYYLVSKVFGAPITYPFGGWPPPLGIVYEVDLFSALMGVLITVIMFLIAVYSIWYMRNQGGYEWFYTLFIGLEAGMIGCVYTGDAFNLFVMLEVMSVSAYALVAFYRTSKEAVEAGIKYALIGAVSTTVYFIALVFIYGAFGTLNMADIAVKARNLMQYDTFYLISSVPVGNIGLAAAIALGLSIWTFTFKAAVFPNHFWLPDAHPAAPTPISAVLSGLVVNVGAYALIRFFYTLFGPGAVSSVTSSVSGAMTIIVVLGAVTAVIASTLMMVQRDLKRLIAYSTVLHLGLIVAVVSLGTDIGLTAGIYHTVNHAVAKALLFLSAGVFIKAVGTRDVDRMAGIARYAPVAALAMVAATFSLIGLPPFGGFFSKLLMYQAFTQSVHTYLIVVLLVSSAFALLAYMKILYTVWFRYPIKEITGFKEDLTASIPLIVMTAIVVILGILSPILLDKVFNPVTASILDYNSYIKSAYDVLNEVIKAVGVLTG